MAEVEMSIRYGIPVTTGLSMSVGDVMSFKMFDSFDEASMAQLKDAQPLWGDVIYEFTLVARVTRHASVVKTNV